MKQTEAEPTDRKNTPRLSAWQFPNVSSQRSRNMAAIRSRNTKPECIVRSALHRMGYRFRLHVRSLAGCPDIVMPKHQAVVFVHGCFWHGHGCRVGRRTPKTNRTYWLAKRERNRSRHETARKRLRRAGWRVLTIWECQTRDVELLKSRLRGFLRDGKNRTRSRKH
jgi:DNA mismatch endonuclease (patch repair protein)